jgi:hypothetical protein
MTMDRQSAATSLSAIEHAERRTTQVIFYGSASSFLILWGVVTTVGYGIGQAFPGHAGIVWPVLMVIGFAATAAIIRRNRGGLTARQSALEWRIASAQIALIGFGVLTVATLGPFTGRQLDAFWPLVFMLGYVLAGIWVGRFFVFCGVAIALLTIAGFWWAGPGCLCGWRWLTAGD